MWARFKVGGRVPLSKDSTYILINGPTTCLAIFFKSLGPKPSGPGAFPLCMDLMEIRTSWAVIGLPRSLQLSADKVGKIILSQKFFLSADESLQSEEYRSW